MSLKICETVVWVSNSLDPGETSSLLGVSSVSKLFAQGNLVVIGRLWVNKHEYITRSQKKTGKGGEANRTIYLICPKHFHTEHAITKWLLSTIKMSSERCNSTLKNQNDSEVTQGNNHSILYIVFSLFCSFFTFYRIINSFYFFIYLIASIRQRQL